MKIYNSSNNKRLLKTLAEKEDFTFLHFTGSMLGVGAPALSNNSLEKVNELKERDDSKGYICLIPDPEWLKEMGIKVNKMQRRLIQQYWPGDLTLLFNNYNAEYEHLAIAGKIAVRIPDHNLIRDFMRTIQKPVVSTSVNRSGNISETNVKDIERNYRNWFDFGLLPKGLKLLTSRGSTIIDCTDKEPQLIRDGNISWQHLDNSIRKPLILFICTGNICRSPLAEYYTQSEVERHGLPFRIRSAGFMEAGHCISRNSGKILEEIGINTDSHRSYLIDNDILAKSWLILTMEDAHKKKLLQMDPGLGYKTFTLSEYCGPEFYSNSLDIDDPYGSDLDRYRITYNMIKARIDRLLEKIKKEV